MADAVDKKTSVEESVKMVTLTIDGREVSVPRGTTVLNAARKLNIDIPTFCAHPKLKPVGVCRMCYVEIEKMPKLAVSCATEVMDGMIVHTDTEKVRQGRRAVLEFQLLNHPLDCPTCDQGGECTLQDLTFAHGIDDSRFAFQKYRFRDEESRSTFDDRRIGPEIIQNRNRCIQCMRCVRANKEAFGEYDLGAFERGNMTQIGAAPGEEVDNPFSGNLTEICPVGALTSSDFRYKIRVWLTQMVPSVCPFTSTGANIWLYKEDHRQKILRVMSRCNDAVDDGWLPDITRYGYQIVTSADRLQTPLIKREGKQEPASWDAALEVIRKRLTEIVDKKGCVCIGGLISPDLDNTTLYSFSKLIRVTLGSNNIDYRCDYRMLPKTGQGCYDVLTGRPFTIADIDDSDVIITFGTDLLKEHHNEYLRIRKAYNFNGSKIYAINPYGVKAADVAQRELVYKAGTEEILINGLCLAALEDGLVESHDLRSKINPASATEAATQCGVDLGYLKEVAAALANGRKVTFIVGEIVSRSLHRELIASALCNLNRLYSLEKKGQIAVLARYANSRGAEKLGLLPEPNQAIRNELASIWGTWPEAEPLNTDKMLINMKKEEIDGGIIVGANPLMLYPDREFARESIERLDFLVVADMFETETTALADVVLPLASWAEYSGQYVNLEGRCQQATHALKPMYQARPGYEIIDAIAEQMGNRLFESEKQREDEIIRLLELDSMLAWPEGYLEVQPATEKDSEEYSVPLFVGDDPHHSGYLTEKSNSLVDFCGEAYIEMSPSLADKHKLSEGDSVRVESEVGKIIVPVRISRTIKNDAVFIPRNFSSTLVMSLLMRKRRVDRVRISRVEK